MYRFKIGAIATAVSLLALFTSCSKDKANSLGQESPVEQIEKQAPKHSIELGLDFDLGVQPFEVQGLDKESEEGLRALQAKVGKNVGDKIEIKNEGKLTALMILRCKNTSVNIPYFYKKVTFDPKDTGKKKKEFTLETKCATTNSFNFVWNDPTHFEQLKKGTDWEVMFFYSKDIADNTTTYKVGTKTATHGYKLGEDVNIEDMDIPFYSDWQPVEVVEHQDNVAGHKSKATGNPKAPLYTLQLGKHTLKPQGIVARVHFDNKLPFELAVNGFKVETNAYNFQGTYDISKTALEGNGGKPKYIYNATANPGTNIKGETCYIRTFSLATPVSVPKSAEGLSDCLFWMMPEKTTPAKPYTQIYLNATADAGAGTTCTNANGHIPDDSKTALSNGPINHGAVAAAALHLQVPSIKCLPVYARRLSHNITTQNGKAVHATLDIRRPKTFIEWIAETPVVPAVTPEGNATPDRTDNGFATDLAFPEKLYNMYENVGGVWTIRSAYANEADVKRNESRFNYSYDVGESLATAAGYIVPDTRQWYSYCIQPYSGDLTNAPLTKSFASYVPTYASLSRTAVAQGYEYNGEYYKAPKTGKEAAADWNSESYISGVKDLNGGKVAYSMRFAEVDGKQYRVVTRYFAYEGDVSGNYPFLIYSWNKAMVNNSTGRYPTENTNKFVPLENTMNKMKPVNAYQSVTVRYIGKNYVFNDDADLMTGPNAVWATEDFWKKNNDDDIVRYYPKYGYTFDMCFRATGHAGMYWTKKNLNGKTGDAEFKDLFMVVKNGFISNAYSVPPHFNASIIKEDGHRYGCARGAWADKLPLIPVTDKDWGEK